MDSKRLPGKAVIPVLGQPLLSRLIDRISPLSAIGKIVVATTNRDIENPIVEIAKKRGALCFRGKVEDAVSRFIGAAKENGGDILVRITGDNPLTDTNFTIEALNLLLSNKLDYVGIKGLPVGISSEVFTLKSLIKLADLTTKAIHRESITSYMYMNPDKFKVGFINKEGTKYYRPFYRLTVDTEDDKRLVENIYNILGDSPSLVEIINLLDSRPDLVSINRDILQRGISEYL